MCLLIVHLSSWAHCDTEEELGTSKPHVDHTGQVEVMIRREGSGAAISRHEDHKAILPHTCLSISTRVYIWNTCVYISKYTLNTHVKHTNKYIDTCLWILAPKLVTPDGERVASKGRSAHAQFGFKRDRTKGPYMAEPITWVLAFHNVLRENGVQLIHAKLAITCCWKSNAKVFCQMLVAIVLLVTPNVGC